MSDLYLSQWLYIDLLALLSLTSTQTSLPSTKSNLTSFIHTQGQFQKYNLPIIILNLCRWHEHDPEEIIQTVRVCISETVKNLEREGWTRTSIKVIGVFIRLPVYVCR